MVESVMGLDRVVEFIVGVGTVVSDPFLSKRRMLHRVNRQYKDLCEKGFLPLQRDGRGQRLSDSVVDYSADAKGSVYRVRVCDTHPREDGITYEDKWYVAPNAELRASQFINFERGNVFDIQVTARYSGPANGNLSLQNARIILDDHVPGRVSETLHTDITRHSYSSFRVDMKGCVIFYRPGVGTVFSPDFEQLYCTSNTFFLSHPQQIFPDTFAVTHNTGRPVLVSLSPETLFCSVPFENRTYSLQIPLQRNMRTALDTTYQKVLEEYAC